MPLNINQHWFSLEISTASQSHLLTFKYNITYENLSRYIFVSKESKKFCFCSKNLDVDFPVFLLINLLFFNKFFIPEKTELKKLIKI